MGVEDKEGESLLSEADEEKDKERDASDVEEEKDTEKETSDLDDSEPDSRKKYKCTQPGCNARFLRPSRLTWHLRKHNDERPYKCDREGCDRAYTNSSHLKRHLNTTHKPVTKTYECQECGMELGSLFSLKRHNKKIHDPTRLTCNECGAKFRKKHCYNEHLSMHAGIAMYKCDICEQKFTTLRLYKKHHRIHESMKTYPCTAAGCTEIFDKWSKLNKHLETKHEYDHKCEKCNKEFKNKKQLQIHSAIHTREGIVLTCPYQNCPRFYSYTRNLDEHILTVHMGRRFLCDICDKPFNFKSAIARHIQVIHVENGKPTTKRKNPRRRKDAGVHKKSMVAKLVGLELPDKLEKRILLREPRIILDKTVIASSDKSKQRDQFVLSSSLTDSTLENEIPVASKKHEKESFLSSEDKNEIIDSSSTIESGTANNESDTAMILDDHVPESADTSNERNEEILFSVINALQSENAPVPLKEMIKECSNVSEKRTEIKATFWSDVSERKSPVVLAEYTEEFADTIEQNNDMLSVIDASSEETSSQVVIEILSDWV